MIGLETEADDASIKPWSIYTIVIPPQLLLPHIKSNVSFIDGSMEVTIKINLPFGIYTKLSKDGTWVAKITQ